MFSFQRRLPAHPPAPRAALARPATALPAERPLSGCGWFDSSHDLRSGLRVEEELPPEAVARLVPLSWWLAWELEGTPPSVR